jgi:hypothetical protein
MLDITFYRRTEDTVQVLVQQPGQLQPGQILAFAGSQQAKTYGKITAIRHSRKQKLGLVTLHMVTADHPDPEHTQAQVVLPAEQLAIIHQQLGRVRYPLTLNTHGGPLLTDAARLAPLTWLDNRDAQALQAFLPNLLPGLAQHSRLVIMDPTGVIQAMPGCHTLAIGQDCPLNLQLMGWHTFTQVFSQCLPTPLQGASLDYLLPLQPTDRGFDPSTSEFIPFSHLMKPILPDNNLEEGAQRVIQHGLQQVGQLHLFADDPDTAFHPSQLTHPTLLQLGHLPQPWRSAALQLIWRQLVQSTAATCLLIEPERFLPDIGLISPQHTVLVASAAEVSGSVSQLVRHHGQWVLQGQITAGFPVTLAAMGQTSAHTRLVQPLYDATDALPAMADEAAFAEAMEEETEPAVPPVTAYEAMPLANALPSDSVEADDVPQAEWPSADVGTSTTETPDPLFYDPFYEPVATDPVAETLWHDNTPGDEPQTVLTTVLPHFELDKLDTLAGIIPEDALPQFALDSAGIPLENLEASSIQTDNDDWPDLNTSDLGMPEAAIPVEEPAVGSSVVADPTPTFVPAAQVEPEIPPADVAWGSGQFAEGDVVRHPKYGQGTVKKVIWMDAEHEVINVQFERAGKRLLDPSMAALEKIIAG